MKYKNFNYNQVKKFVKDNISNLEDYSLGEEDCLIEETLSLPKGKLLFKDFSIKELNKIKNIVKKRKKGIPLNKIFNHCFFYKDNFFINKNVLAPRQETEILVEYALKEIEKIDCKNISVLDLCCGSGIIGLSILKHSKKNCSVTLSDISKKAIKVAKKNAGLLGIKEKLTFIKSNLFNGLKVKNKFDIILSNPPYIKSSNIKDLTLSVKNYDPKIALDGGKDGLDFYKIICKQAGDYLKYCGVVIVEIGFDQKTEVEKIFKENNFSTICKKDFSNNDRIIIAKKDVKHD